jgi:hypothetical protein
MGPAVALSAALAATPVPGAAQGVGAALHLLETCRAIATTGTFSPLDGWTLENPDWNSCQGRTLCVLARSPERPGIDLAIWATGGRDGPIVEMICDPAPGISFPDLRASELEGWAREEIEAGRLGTAAFLDGTEYDDVDRMLAGRQAFLEGCGADGVTYSLTLGLVDRIGANFAFSIDPPEQRSHCVGAP